MNSLIRESLHFALSLLVLVTGARAAGAGAPPLIVSVGDSVRVTGLITVEPNPPPIGYPGPILTDIEPRMFERRPAGADPRPIRMLLLLMHGAQPPAPRTRTTYRVAVAGRYNRLLGADSVLVTSYVIEAEFPDAGPDRRRGARFRTLYETSRLTGKDESLSTSVERDESGPPGRAARIPDGVRTDRTL